jgi:hypothetical protein
VAKQLYLLDDEDVLMISSVIGHVEPVERCEHGRIDPHKYRLICYHVTAEVCRKSSRCWCEGAGL